PDHRALDKVVTVLFDLLNRRIDQYSPLGPTNFRISRFSLRFHQVCQQDRALRPVVQDIGWMKSRQDFESWRQQRNRCRSTDAANCRCVEQCPGGRIAEGDNEGWGGFNNFTSQPIKLRLRNLQRDVLALRQWDEWIGIRVLLAVKLFHLSLADAESFERIAWWSEIKDIGEGNACLREPF